MVLPGKCAANGNDARQAALASSNMACWTADNTKTLIALVITQLAFTGAILVCVAVAVAFVIGSVKRVEQSVSTVADAAAGTAKDIQKVTQSVGQSATQFLGAAASSMETIVGKRVGDLGSTAANAAARALRPGAAS